MSFPAAAADSSCQTGWQYAGVLPYWAVRMIRADYPRHSIRSSAQNSCRAAPPRPDWCLPPPPLPGV